VISFSGRGLTRVPEEAFAAGFFRRVSKLFAIHQIRLQTHYFGRTLCLDDNAFTELPDSLRCLTSLLELQVLRCMFTATSSTRQLTSFRRSAAAAACSRSLPAFPTCTCCLLCAWAAT
jgi:hypothetical protein